MKNKLLALLVLLLMIPAMGWADNFVNLTPRPKTMTVGTGLLTLPASFTISCKGLDESMQQEVERFAAELQQVTGCNIQVADGDESALFQFQKAPSKQKDGGYNLIVATTGVKVLTTEVLGTYYACQTLKKIMPACVMAGVKDPKVSEFTLPCVTIVDEPRFAYRGFMLDVSRHFFTVDEVKRMLDVMSYYKLNRFHWHLSDDQGWRVEIKKYPRLTTVGSIAPNCRFTDMDSRSQYWINKPYGPYFYTQDQVREVVAYAKERHIEVIPEIDMPGHFCAAMAAYPEFSCTPYAGHAVMTDGGIYSDVMNVANPQAVQFVKDVLAELIDLFPCEYINIGGDECPTSAWESNAQCQALYKQLGLTSYRQLQSHFIKEMADFVQSKGRKLAVWNEAITANGADLDLMKQTGATVYCWTGAEAAVKKAASMGMPRIYTPWGPYYINRRQGTSEQDPPGAGDGTDNVKKTYNTVPPSETDLGVQGTFWTEHVSDAAYMEWLALPRLLAIAEAGWTPQDRKDFADFQKRMSADTTLLNYGNYRYCNYFMLDAPQQPSDDKVMPKVSQNGQNHYYRIVSGATDARKDRCIELLAEGSQLIADQAGKGAKANVLWTNAQASEGDANFNAQWWRLEEDAANPGHFALVCKAQPDGSVNPVPTKQDNTGRWNYDTSVKHYSFVLGTAAYGQKGSNYYYSIMSDELEGKYLNSSMAGQGMAVNVYADPASGGGGQWEFQPEQTGTTPGVTENPEWLEEGKTYSFRNAVDGFAQTALATGNSASLAHTTDRFVSTSWKVVKSQKNDDGSQTVRLVTPQGQSISSVGSFVGQTGWPVNVGAESAAMDVVVRYVPADKAYRLLVDGHSLYAHPSGLVYAGATIQGASYDAPRGQGAEWTFGEAADWTLECVDETGRSLGTVVCTLPSEVLEVTADLCPEMANHSVAKVEPTADHAVKVTYRRTAYAVTYRCTDRQGNELTTVTEQLKLDESHTVKCPEVPYYSLESVSAKEGTLIAGCDSVVEAVYTTRALTGVKQVGKAVSELENGHSYLLYDASSDSRRVGFRRIMPDTKVINRLFSAEPLDPTGVWTLEGKANNFKVYNACYGLYVPTLQRSAPATASKTGATFTFALDDAGDWHLTGANGMKWDGVENGNLVGWNSGDGHPIRIYTFVAQPYFTVSIECTTESGQTLFSSSQFHPAGEAAALSLPSFDGYVLKSVTGNESFRGVVDDFYDVKAVYAPVSEGISTPVTEASKTATSIYDLQGRRLQQVQHPGIYIVNGRKVVVR